MSKKFLYDFAIGNPPYNDDFNNSGDNENYAKPVYHIFMDAANQVADKVELIHPARFLFNAGSTPKEWNEKVLSDEHYAVLSYAPDSSSVFPGVSIPGGVAVTYHDSQDVIGPIGTFTRFPRLNGILKKAAPTTDEESLMSIVYIQNRYNLDALYAEYPESRKLIGSNGRDSRFEKNAFEKIAAFSDVQEDDTVKVLGIYNRKRTWRYIKKRLVDSNHENLSKYKIVLACADGAAGTIGDPVPARIIGRPIIEAPYEGYTRSFIGIGAFDTEDEAKAAQKYVQTKFARAMLGILKATQMANKPTWKYVPMQDFTSKSDIDWSQSVQSIDRQLYAKYGLDVDEIDFIESYIQDLNA